MEGRVVNSMTIRAQIKVNSNQPWRLLSHCCHAPTRLERITMPGCGPLDNAIFFLCLHCRCATILGEKHVKQQLSDFNKGKATYYPPAQLQAVQVSV